MAMKELYCKVHGNVQGVAFRAFAQKEARVLGVTGFAKNIEDGAVEVVAQGQEVKLREFLYKISVGPQEAEVESIDTNWGPIGPDDERFSDFAVI
jgi:acylphosphatase